MGYRPRNKGFQLDINYQGQRHRTQLDCDETEIKIAEVRALQGLKDGKTWNTV